MDGLSGFGQAPLLSRSAAMTSRPRRAFGSHALCDRPVRTSAALCGALSTEMESE